MYLGIMNCNGIRKEFKLFATKDSDNRQGQQYWNTSPHTYDVQDNITELAKPARNCCLGQK